MRKKIQKVLALGMTLTALMSNVVYGYNGQEAANYAFTHYKNTESGDYYYFNGANCTNFVSQCVNFGGIPMKDTGNPSGFYLKGIKDAVLDTDDEINYYWYMKKVSTLTGKVYWYTRSWACVKEFREYQGIRNGIVVQYSQTDDSKRALCSQLKVGDVLQCGNKHSVIITALNDKTEKTIRYCGQTYSSHKTLDQFFKYAEENTPGQKLYRITYK